MLDDNNDVREVNGKPICLLCHTKKPDTAADSTDDVRFRADIGFLCWRCHPPMKADPFFNDHFLVTPSPKTLSQMHQSEERLMVILPIVPRERITCSTCHNPHQKSVIQRESAAKGADTKGKLRLSSICFACHLIENYLPNTLYEGR
jgi:nitrate/TMAO reductase-like tetraheme cytochrome c subunit